MRFNLYMRIILLEGRNVKENNQLDWVELNQQN